MRYLLLLAVAAGCTPEIVPGAYFCGPNKACPEGQACNDADNICGSPLVVAPFECDPDLASEPDDTAETAYPLTNLDCPSLPAVIDSCMLVGDSSDWLKLTAPPACTGLELDARITFPLAFERLGIELVDLSTGTVLATDTECPTQGESGDDLRCARAPLVGGGTYGIHILPTGKDNCGGQCAFNRYTVRVQLSD